MAKITTAIKITPMTTKIVSRTSSTVDSPPRSTGMMPSVSGEVGNGGRVVIPWTLMYSLHSDETNWGGSRVIWSVTWTRTYVSVCRWGGVGGEAMMS